MGRVRRAWRKGVREKFDQDFKESAVRLVRETGEPIAQVRSWSVYICFVPGAEQVDAPFGLAESARGAGVQVRTERASVEHRAADLDQLDQPLVEPAPAAAISTSECSRSSAW